MPTIVVTGATGAIGAATVAALEKRRAQVIKLSRPSGLTLYTVKSTSVGLQMDAGLSDAEIMERGGWKTTAMMQRYRKQNPERAHASSTTACTLTGMRSLTPRQPCGTAPRAEPIAILARSAVSWPIRRSRAWRT